MNEGQGETSGKAGPARRVQRSAVNPAVTPVPDWYLVYMFDDLHLEFGDLDRARDAARRQLRHLSDPATRIAVFSTSGLYCARFHQRSGGSGPTFEKDETRLAVIDLLTAQPARHR